MMAMKRYIRLVPLPELGAVQMEACDDERFREGVEVVARTNERGVGGPVTLPDGRVFYFAGDSGGGFKAGFRVPGCGLLDGVDLGAEDCLDTEGC